MAYTPKLTYKGRPLVRCGNDIYYGSMKDPFVVYLQVLSTKKENGVDRAHCPPGQQSRPVQRAVLRRHHAAGRAAEEVSVSPAPHKTQSPAAKRLRGFCV
mgnify:CR=1 FL=1